MNQIEISAIDMQRQTLKDLEKRSNNHHETRKKIEFHTKSSFLRETQNSGWIHERFGRGASCTKVAHKDHINKTIEETRTNSNERKFIQNFTQKC